MLLNNQIKLISKEKEKISKNKILTAIQDNHNLSRYDLYKHKPHIKILKKIIDISKITLKNNFLKIINY